MTATEFPNASGVRKRGRPTLRKNGVPMTPAEHQRRYRHAIKRKQKQNNFEWYTPADVIKSVREVMGSIDLDPASSELANTVVKAKKIYTKEDNGLIQPWNGNVWINPPYTRLTQLFVDKLFEEIAAGHVKQAILLTHPRTDTEWFRRAAAASASICFGRRIRFWRPNGISDDPTIGIVFFYYGNNTKRFREVFADWGMFANCSEK